jgi:hypothetical protein
MVSSLIQAEAGTVLMAASFFFFTSPFQFILPFDTIQPELQHHKVNQEEGGGGGAKESANREEGGSAFLNIISKLLPNYTASHLEKWYSY